MKGSVAEARKHYKSLADHFQKKGQKIEALEIRKQLADLDPNNTEIYLTIAEAFYQEKQTDEAASAFTEAGLRFNKQEKYESSLTAFTKALEIKKNDLRALNGLVKAQIGLGDADEAARTLEKSLEEQPYNRDILYLLIDCYLESENTAQAEKAILKLVEQEPSSYAKFLELVKLYVKSGDLEAAVRILTLSGEHLLVGGKAENLFEWTNEILTRNPEQTGALKILTQYYNWQRNPDALKKSLEQLAEVARETNDIESERFALAQLELTAPHSENTKRLQELNTLLGYAPDTATEAGDFFDAAQFENFAPVAESEESNGVQANLNEFSFADLKGANDYEFNDAADETVKADIYATADYGELSKKSASDNVNQPAKTIGELNHSDEQRLQREIESIDFYIEQGYQDLAAKSLNELEAAFGAQPQIVDLRVRLRGFAPQPSVEIVADKESPTETSSNEEPLNKPDETRRLESFDELKNQLDTEQAEAVDLADQYETHYHLATAYKEMGLLEDAIREFQDAINLVKMNDGTRRFFQCSNLLGHCFLDKEMPNLAVIWYRRSLEVADLKEEEKHALYYEIGNALEAGGEISNSFHYFEKLYAEDVNYRDVSRRLENLRAENSTA